MRWKRPTINTPGWASREPRGEYQKVSAVSLTSKSPPPPVVPGEAEVVLAIDVGSVWVRTAIVGAESLEERRLPTTTGSEEWSIERLVRIARELFAEAEAGGLQPAALTIGVPGQVDEYHGAVQFSPALPWHDVGVAAEVGAAVDTQVIVRQSTRLGALAEANLGGVVGDEPMLYVSAGATLVAAGAQGGTVVPDHVGAGDLGSMRLRSGLDSGKRLDEVASPAAIARRYGERTGIDPESISAVDVHAAMVGGGDGNDDGDGDARLVWDQAVEALADGLEWATLLFGPETMVIGGGLSNAGDDLIPPLRDGVARRLAPRPTPKIVPATFGEHSGWVGATLAAWQRLHWPVPLLQERLTQRFPEAVDRRLE